MLNVARGPLIVDEDLKAALDSRQGRRRGARRLPHRADHRAPAVRLSQRHRHAAPRRLDGRGDRPRRLPGRRAGRRRADRRRASRRAVNVPAVAAEDLEVLGPVPAARRGARAARRSALAEGVEVDRVEVEFLGPHRRARHAPARRRGRCSACSTGHTEEDVNAVNAPAHRRGARDRARPRRKRTQRARLLRPRPRDGRRRRRSASAWSARRSAAATARTCSRPGASASTSSSRTTWRSSATATCPGMIGRVGTVLRRRTA